MILDPKKKAINLASPKQVFPHKPLTMSLAMQEAARRSERQPKTISMNSRAEFNGVEGK